MQFSLQENVGEQILYFSTPYLSLLSDGDNMAAKVLKACVTKYAGTAG